jgi:hypothetical protein
LLVAAAADLPIVVLKPAAPTHPKNFLLDMDMCSTSKISTAI